MTETEYPYYPNGTESFEDAPHLEMVSTERFIILMHPECAVVFTRPEEDLTQPLATAVDGDVIKAELDMHYGPEKKYKIFAPYAGAPYNMASRTRDVLDQQSLGRISFEFLSIYSRVDLEQMLAMLTKRENLAVFFIHLPIVRSHAEQLIEYLAEHKELPNI